MDPIAADPGAFVQKVGYWSCIVGTGIDLFGMVILFAAMGWTSHLFVKRSMGEQHYELYTHRIGRSLLLGLAVLIVAGIIKTIAFEPTSTSCAVLVGLVLMRRLVNWTLALEIEGLALAGRDA